LPAASAASERFLITACLAFLAVAVFLQNFDDPLLHAVYRWTHAQNAGFWRGVSLLGSGVTLTPVVAALVLALIWRGQSMGAMALAFGWAATSLTVEYLKWLLDRGRPGVTPWDFARGNAFPSGHAAQAFYVCISLGWEFARLSARDGAKRFRRIVRPGIWAILLGIPVAVGYSRVALGVHWPSDIAAGWALGLFFCALAQVLRTSAGGPAAPRARPERGTPGES